MLFIKTVKFYQNWGMQLLVLIYDDVYETEGTCRIYGSIRDSPHLGCLHVRSSLLLHTPAVERDELSPGSTWTFFNDYKRKPSSGVTAQFSCPDILDEF